MGAMDWLVIITWGMMILGIILNAIFNFYISKRKELKRKENIDDKEYNEEDIQRLLKILGKDKRNVEGELDSSLIKVERETSKEIDEYERSRKARLEKIKSKYDKLEVAAEQDYLSHIEKLNRMRENENKDN